MLKENVIGKVSQSDKEKALKAFKEYAKKASFPKEIINLVSLETISDHELYNNRFLMYVKDGMYITLSKNKEGIMRSFPVINRYDVTPDDIAEPLPPLSNGRNTVTKKPYFPIPKALTANLSDKEYFKTLVKVMNSNFGTLMQMYTLDEKKLAKNEYAGKMADMPAFFFGGGYDMLEQGMNQTEIDIRRKLGFVVNGAAEIMKRGGQMHIGVGDCTGWTVHTVGLNSQDATFVVFNGTRNSNGSLGYYRREVLPQKVKYLQAMQTNFHALMREHGVEPGTDVKDTSLTSDDQRVFAYLGNVLDNYQDVFKTARTYRYEGPIDKNEKLMTADKFASKVIFTPVKAKGNEVSTQKTSQKISFSRAQE